MTTNDLYIPTNTPSAAVSSISSGNSTDHQPWYEDAFEDLYEKIGKHHHAISGHVFVASEPDAVPGKSEFGFEATTYLPNLRPEDLEVTVSGNWLTVAGHIGIGHETDESEKNDFYRSFWLSPKLDTNRVHAVFCDGVLNIRIPWQHDAPSSRRQIPITTP